MDVSLQLRKVFAHSELCLCNTRQVRTPRLGPRRMSSPSGSLRSRLAVNTVQLKHFDGRLSVCRRGGLRAVGLCWGAGGATHARARFRCVHACALTHSRRAHKSTGVGTGGPGSCCAPERRPPAVPPDCSAAAVAGFASAANHTAVVRANTWTEGDVCLSASLSFTVSVSVCPCFYPTLKRQV